MKICFTTEEFTVWTTRKHSQIISKCEPEGWTPFINLPPWLWKFIRYSVDPHSPGTRNWDWDILQKLK